MYKFLRNFKVPSFEKSSTNFGCCLVRTNIGQRWQVQRRHSYMVEALPRGSFKLALLHWICRLRSRYCMWKLRRLMPPDFDESMFLVGARQAAATIINAVQAVDWSSIHNCCTDRGACEIYGLTQSLRNFNYTKLLRFECQHLFQVSPISVQRQCEMGRTFVYVKISFVGLRDIRDFATFREQQEIFKLTRLMLEESELLEQFSPFHHRLVVGQFVVTLALELGLETHDWLVDFYNVFGFKLINYSPVTLKYRIIELQKPV